MESPSTDGWDSHFLSAKWLLSTNTRKQYILLPQQHIHVYKRKGFKIFHPLSSSFYTVSSSSSSSSPSRAISMGISDPLSLPLPTVHCFWQVLKATSCIGTELLYVGSSWTSCLCSSMWRGPQEYITKELVPTTPAVSCMSGSSSLDSFHDGWLVVVQLLLCRVLSPGRMLRAILNKL